MSRSHHAWRKTLTRSLGAANSDQRIYLSGPGESQSCTANPGPSNSCFKRGNPWPNSATKTHFKKNKNRRRLYCLRWSGGRAPRVICAPTFVPPFSSLHPCTLVSTPSILLVLKILL